MKKIIVLLSLIFICPYAFAGQYSTTLDKIENSLFGFTYSNEAENTRINRIAKLKKDLSVDEMGKEIEPKEDTFASPEDSWVVAKEPVESTKIDYPVINELEKQVFKQEFKSQNIKTRLSKLESKTFGKTYENDDLSSRVDRLKAKIKPQTFMANGMQQQENKFYNDTIGKMDDNYHLDQYGSPNFDYDFYNKRNNKSNKYNDVNIIAQLKCDNLSCHCRTDICT